MNKRCYRKVLCLAAAALCALAGCNGCSQTAATEDITKQEGTTGDAVDEYETELTEAATEVMTEETTPEETTAALTVEERRAARTANPEQPLMTFYNRHTEYVQYEKEPGEALCTWTDFSNYVDIVQYTVFASDERESIAYGDFRDLYKTWWESYPLAAQTKIGYELILALKDGSERIITITEPSDTEEIFTYIEVYLYDDYHHAYGEWYSHLLEDSMTEETLITGIKLTPGEHADTVEGMTLTVFTYLTDPKEPDGEEFDRGTGRYVGGNYQTVQIVNTAE